MQGGDLVAEVLKKQGVPFLFTLCGGHISPILVGAKKRGIRVIDVRHEANAVFAADSVARLTGTPGVAAVTAGPGLTNTVTAVKNALLAQSPIIVIGGATATVLRGRGSLQDIDQMELMRPNVKKAIRITKVKDIVPMLEEAFRISLEGVPGPVFVECPIDLLYDEELVKSWYGVKSSDKKQSIPEQAVNTYLKAHAWRMFSGSNKEPNLSVPFKPIPLVPSNDLLQKLVAQILMSKNPLMVIGSQALMPPWNAERLKIAIESIGVPVYLSGMARGLLGKEHPLQMRHGRKQALKKADLVILLGVPCDFRLDYGRHITKSSFYVSVNRCSKELVKNKKPNLAINADPAQVLLSLYNTMPKASGLWNNWISELKQSDGKRNEEIAKQALLPVDNNLNPLFVCQEIEKNLADNSMIVADGGDFVGTAAYILQPRKNLTWLDPGVFGTLGVGAGFALGAKLVNPESDVWIIYGDGSFGYTLNEFDTFVRHNIPVIAVIGNDACWSQIAREQVEILKDDVGTVLAHTKYDEVIKGFGGKGFLVSTIDELNASLESAVEITRDEKLPVVINCLIGKTDFRKGSISM